MSNIIEVACDAATARYQDSDEFDVNDIELSVHAGWNLIGDTGWVTDSAWNDVDWAAISDSLAALNRESCVEDTPDLPDGFAALKISHDDDDSNRKGTSETCAWWKTFIFKSDSDK